MNIVVINIITIYIWSGLFNFGSYILPTLLAYFWGFDVPTFLLTLARVGEDYKKYKYTYKNRFPIVIVVSLLCSVLYDHGLVFDKK